MRIAIIAAVSVLCMCSLPVHAAEETRFYDAQGRYQGRATTNTANPEQQSVYDNHGKYVGRVMTDENGNSRVYDSHGKYMGRTTGQPPKTKQ